jgi:hypothetical protein
MNMVIPPSLIAEKVRSIVYPTGKTSDAKYSDGFRLVSLPSTDVMISESCNHTTILYEATTVSAARSDVTLRGTLVGRQYTVEVTTTARVLLTVGPIEYQPLGSPESVQTFTVVATEDDVTANLQLSAADVAIVTVKQCVSFLAVASGSNHIRVAWTMPALSKDISPVVIARLSLQKASTSVWATVATAEVKPALAAHFFEPNGQFATGTYQARIQLCAGVICSDAKLSQPLIVKQEAVDFSSSMLAILYEQTLTLTWPSPATLPNSMLYRWCVVADPAGTHQLLGWAAVMFQTSDSQRSVRVLTATEQSSVQATTDIFVLVEVLLLEGITILWLSFLATSRACIRRSTSKTRSCCQFGTQ